MPEFGCKPGEEAHRIRGASVKQIAIFTRGRSRPIAAAEGGLALAQSGKLPHARTARVRVGANVGVDEIGPARRERGSQRVGKIGGAVWRCLLASRAAALLR